MKHIFLTIALLLLSHDLFAVPRKFSSCEVRSRVTAPPTSGGHFVSDDCRTVYALPPTEGTVSVDSISTDLNTDMCSISRGALEQLKRVSDNIRQFRQKLNAEANGIEKNDSALVKLSKQCSQLRSDLGSLQIISESAESELSYLIGQIKTKNQAISQCIAEKGSDNFDCTNFQDQIDKLILQKKRVEAKLEKIGPAYARYKSASAVCDKTYADQRERLITESSVVASAQARLTEAERELKDIFENQIKRERDAVGAIVNVTVNMKMVELLNSYKEANKTLVDEGISFETLPVKTMSMTFRGVSDGVEAGYPVVREQSISGKNANGGDLNLEALQTAGAKNVEKLFRGAATGYIVINRLAACDLSRTKSADPKTISAKDIADFLRPVVKYDYEVQTGKSYSVKYSENHLYQLIKEQSTSGGLFRTSGSNKVLERTEANKWLQIEFKSESTENNWQSEETMANEIRATYLDAAIAKKAKEYLQTNADVEFYSPGQTNGAKVASEGLKKCGHAYCQVAAVVFDFSDAVFGGSTSSAEMTRTLSVQDSIFVNIEKMVSGHGGTIFKANRD